MRGTILPAMLLIAAAMLGGCHINIGAGDIGTGWGGGGYRSQSSYSVVRPFVAGKNTLAGFTGIQVGQVFDGTGGRLPPAFMNHFAAELRDELKHEKLPSEPGGLTLVLRCTVTRYDTDVIVGVDAVDPRNGAVLGTANCIGSTGEPDPDKGMRKRAEELAKAVADWLKTGFPKR